MGATDPLKAEEGTLRKMYGISIDINSVHGSDSVENGVKNLRKNIEFRWENSEFLQQYIPETKFTDIRWEFTNAAGKSFVVRGFGALCGVRGA